MTAVRDHAGHAPGALLDALYGTVLGEGAQEEFNQMLAQATGASVVAVLRHDVAHGQGDVAVIHGRNPERMAAALAAHDLHQDPWITRVVPQLATGKVIDSDTLLPRKEMQRTDAFNSYYRQLDIGQQVASVGHYDGSNSVTLSICREVGAPAFDEAELGVLRALTPHWVNAYAIQRRLSWLEQRVSTLEQAVDSVSTAMLLLDGEQRVIRANPAAEQLLVQGSVLILQQRRLMAPWQPRPLQQVLHAACKGTEQHGELRRSAGTAMVVNQAGRNTLIAYAHPIMPMIGQGGAETAVVFVQPVGMAPAATFKDLLRALFSLTTAEALLAEAMFLHPDLAEAASHAGISPATAQTRIKVIYDKTGERGQPALLRLLSAIAASLPRLSSQGR